MTKKKLKPCDCIDMRMATMLNEQGISHNGEGIRIEPNLVILTLGNTTVSISMQRFKMFAEWYLAEQDIEHDKSESHTCIYSRSINQTYPRLCVICGKPENKQTNVISK